MTGTNEHVKYGIQIPFEDGWLFILESHYKSLDTAQPLLYNNYIDAEDYAKTLQLKSWRICEYNYLQCDSDA